MGVVPAAAIPVRLALALALAACAKPPPPIEEVPVRPCRISTTKLTIDLAWDDRGRQISRREQRAGFAATEWSWRYDGDRIAEQILDGSHFVFEHDAAGHHVATTLGTRRTWTGTYEGDRLVREVSDVTTDHTYDRYGRPLADHTQLRVMGTVDTTYAYDDALCRRYRPPLDLPGARARPPCPIAIVTVDSGGRREERPSYRDGRLVEDGHAHYHYDDAGRLIREQMLRVPDGSLDERYDYDCR